MAILGTIPVRTAPRPLYRPRGVSRFTISAPVFMKPRRGACEKNARLSMGFSLLHNCARGAVHTYTRLPRSPGKLHSDFDRVCTRYVRSQLDNKTTALPLDAEKLTKRMARQRFHHTGTSASYIGKYQYMDNGTETMAGALPMRFVAAEAGFLPFGPFTLFADMISGPMW